MIKSIDGVNMISLIDTLIHQAECRLGYSLQLDFEIIDSRVEFPKKRNCAYTNGEKIFFSSKMLRLPIENQIAVIAHEIAHCDLIQRDIPHTERRPINTQKASFILIYLTTKMTFRLHLVEKNADLLIFPNKT